ncbi:hypothetical protein ACPW96_22780 [Micromonospora sp. DT81.3]|uniref:hypothetical protein n=1 Tax=Micromonospora sp. DT81.3 TaxID=3416523 RepID=UPI003CF7D41F
MLGTASELWSMWRETGVLRPQDYDTDIVTLVMSRAEQLGIAGDSVDDVLLGTEWTARDLLRTLAPAVASFAGMMRDLLRLLARVGATSGTGESLRLQYEFAEDDVIDESLAQFREMVRQVETTLTTLRPLNFDPSHAFDSPIREYWTWESAGLVTNLSESSDLFKWPFDAGIPSPPVTGVTRVDELVARSMEIVSAALALLAGVAVNTDDLREWRNHPDNPREGTLYDLAQAASDLWPIGMATATHVFASGVADGSLEPDDELLDNLDDWIKAFDSGEPDVVEVERTVEALTDVLSLPMWGRRHELYSAWIATQIDRALEGRLDFVVRDGSIRFPFKALLIARLDAPSGDVDLWSEVRSEAQDVSGGGRKGAIQPDYRFVRRTAHADLTVAAIEVKQYLRSATKNPGAALRDYVLGLPDSTVILVAHGPLGKNVLDAVPKAERGRARVHRHVRVGQPGEEAAFRRDIAGLFPPRSKARVVSIELRWRSDVEDLDLHIAQSDGVETSWKVPSTAHSVLRSDAKRGGPEIVDLADMHDPLDVRVNLYSSDVPAIAEARPRVTFVGSDGARLEVEMHRVASEGRGRVWNVGTIDESGVAKVNMTSRIIGVADPVTSRQDE